MMRQAPAELNLLVSRCQAASTASHAPTDRVTINKVDAQQTLGLRLRENAGQPGVQMCASPRAHSWGLACLSTACSRVLSPPNRACVCSEAVDEGVTSLFRVNDVILCIGGVGVGSQAAADEIFAKRPQGQVDVLIERAQGCCISHYRYDNQL